MVNGNAPRKQRRRRADGELSRQRILKAAAEIAAERGYKGTSISAVSGKCGLPASSIYWHFKDKDDLLAAVIEHSFEQWLSAWSLPDEGGSRQRAEGVGRQIAKALAESPDFIRLGLMLTLEQRLEEPRARARFLGVRAQAYHVLCQSIGDLIPLLAPTHIHQLATYALAGADGLFIAKEIGGDSIDLVAQFEMHARAIYETAVRLAAEDSEKDIA